MRILGIETSCDETAVAIVEDCKKLLTNVVASSAEIHRKYGGIVPEVAARKQVESIIPVLTEAMTGYTKDDIDAIAVTVGPGLIGSLLVGVETAKTLAFAWNKPIIPVNHVLAHIYAVFLEQKNNLQLTTDNLQPIKFPAIALVVSGGHTELYLMNSPTQLRWLGGTLDDAAGECFDKTARLLGLPYPGGPAIAAAAAKLTTYNRQLTTKLPRPMIDDDSLNFSFSGLKTAVLREWKKHQELKNRHSGEEPKATTPESAKNGSWTSQDDSLVSTFAFEIQEAITDVLIAKTFRVATEHKVKSIIVTGGVAANKRLSQKFSSQFAVRSSQLSLYVPPPKFCVDSASYIAAYAHYHNKPVDWRSIEAKPDLSVEI